MSEKVQVAAKKPEVKRDNPASKSRNADQSQSMSSPVDQVLYLQRTIGNQAVQRLIKSGALQAKLKIGQPGDRYEQEADRVADEVMRMPEPGVQRQVEPEEEEEVLIQTKPLVGQITPLVQRQVGEEGKVKENKKIYGEKEAPIFALPLKYRLFIDPKTMVFVDTPYFYTKTEMEGFYKYAKESKNTYERVVEKLKEKYVDLKCLDSAKLYKRKGQEIVERTFSEVMQVCVDQKEMVAAAWTHVMNPHSDNFCKIEIPKPENPFLVFPFWQHERVHQKDCLTLVEKAKQKHKYITPARVAASGEFDTATIWIKSEIDAYRVTFEEIQRELETYEKKSFEPTSGAPMSLEETYSIHRKQKGEKEKEIFQTKEITSDLESQINAIKGGGRPLAESERAYFEPRFDRDFSGVRVHTDMNASESAKALNAKAYTVGQDVVFGEGEYTPFSNEGKMLFAHELAHVAQQEEIAITQYAILNRQPKSKALVQKQESGESLSTDELALSIGREYIKNNRTQNVKIKNMINQYAGKISSELHSLSHKSLADNLKKTWNQYLKGQLDDPKLYVSELRLHFLRNEARYRLISFGEDPALTKHFGEYPPSFGQIIGDRCLDAFYANLEKLYPGDILRKIEETNTTKQILLIKNTLLRLQRQQRGYIPEAKIYAKVQDKMDESRVHEVLEIMSNLKPTMVKGNRTRDKWKSTKEFGGGMLTKTMTDLAAKGMAAPKIDIAYNTKEPKNETEKENVSKRICDQAAKKIWAELQYRCGKYDSNYFFALSLHMDHHCVTLRVERKMGKIKTFWIDQGGEELVANVQELSRRMNIFWPSNYWPKYSTLWQFYPASEELNTLREVSQKITSYEN